MVSCPHRPSRARRLRPILRRRRASGIPRARDAGANSLQSAKKAYRRDADLRWSDMEAAGPLRAPPAGRRALRSRLPRARSANDRAFERLYQQHALSVYQYALAVMANPTDAEDVTQTAFLNAYRAYQRGERPLKPHNWLIKITHNVCRMRWRESQRRPELVPLDHVGEPATLEEEKPSLDEVLQALASLPFNQRAAIVMRELEDRSYKEIAETLGVSVASVEALLFRARRNLQLKRNAFGVLSTAPLPATLAGLGGGSGLVAGGASLVSVPLAVKLLGLVGAGVMAGGGSSRGPGAAGPAPRAARADAVDLVAPPPAGGPPRPRRSDSSACSHCA